MSSKKLLSIFIVALLLIVIGLILFGKKITFLDDLEYEKNNFVISKVDEDYYTDIIHIGLNKLCIEGITVMVRDGNTYPDLPELTLRAFIKNSGNQFVIYVFNLDKNEVIEVLAHELIHLEQYYSGRLLEIDSVIFFEDGVFFTNSLPHYYDRPWEVEAFAKQFELETYIKDIVLQ